MDLSRGICVLCSNNPTKVIFPPQAKDITDLLCNILENFIDIKKFDDTKSTLKVCTLCLYDILQVAEYKKKIEAFSENTNSCSLCNDDEHLVAITDWKQFDLLLENIHARRLKRCLICLACIKFLDCLNRIKVNFLIKYGHLELTETGKFRKQQDKDNAKNNKSVPKSSKKRTRAVVADSSDSELDDKPLTKLRPHNNFKTALKHLKPLESSQFDVEEYKGDMKLLSQVAFVKLSFSDLTQKNQAKQSQKKSDKRRPISPNDSDSSTASSPRQSFFKIRLKLNSSRTKAQKVTSGMVVKAKRNSQFLTRNTKELMVKILKMDLDTIKQANDLDSESEEDDLLLHTPTKASQKSNLEDPLSSSKKRKSVTFAEDLNVEITDGASVRKDNTNGTPLKSLLKKSNSPTSELLKDGSVESSDDEAPLAGNSKKKRDKDIDSDEDIDASKSYVREIQENNDNIFDSLKSSDAETTKSTKRKKVDSSSESEDMEEKSSDNEQSTKRSRKKRKTSIETEEKDENESDMEQDADDSKKATNKKTKNNEEDERGSDSEAEDSQEEKQSQNEVKSDEEADTKKDKDTESGIDSEADDEEDSQQKQSKLPKKNKRKKSKSTESDSDDDENKSEDDTDEKKSKEDSEAPKKNKKRSKSIDSDSEDDENKSEEDIDEKKSREDSKSLRKNKKRSKSIESESEDDENKSGEDGKKSKEDSKSPKKTKKRSKNIESDSEDDEKKSDEESGSKEGKGAESGSEAETGEEDIRRKESKSLKNKKSKSTESASDSEANEEDSEKKQSKPPKGNRKKRSKSSKSDSEDDEETDSKKSKATESGSDAEADEEDSQEKESKSPKGNKKNRSKSGKSDSEDDEETDSKKSKATESGSDAEDDEENSEKKQSKSPKGNKKNRSKSSKSDSEDDEETESKKSKATESGSDAEADEDDSQEKQSKSPKINNKERRKSATRDSEDDEKESDEARDTTGEKRRKSKGKSEDSDAEVENIEDENEPTTEGDGDLPNGEEASEGTSKPKKSKKLISHFESVGSISSDSSKEDKLVTYSEFKTIRKSMEGTESDDTLDNKHVKKLQNVVEISEEESQGDDVAEPCNEDDKVSDTATNNKNDVGNDTGTAKGSDNTNDTEKIDNVDTVSDEQVSGMVSEGAASPVTETSVESKQVVDKKDSAEEVSSSVDSDKVSDSGVSGAIQNGDGPTVEEVH